MQQGSECSTPSAPSFNQLPVARPRRSSAGHRAAAAAAASAAEVYPVSLSPHPLFRPISPIKSSVPKILPHFSKNVAAPNVTDTVAVEDEQLSPSVAREVSVKNKAKIPRAILQIVFSYIGDDWPSIKNSALTCKAWQVASFTAVSELVLIPDITSIACMSRIGSLSSLGELFRVSTRGQHLRKFVMIRSAHVYSFPNSLHGPEMTLQGLSKLLTNFPFLQFLDVRGIKYRNSAAWCDHFLSDVTQYCPHLQVLRIGVPLLRGWEPGFWSQLPELRELVVGSRREDANWEDPSSPMQLADDFFAMLRTSSTLRVVKVWCQVTQSTLLQFMHPSAAFPNIQHLAINVFGNTHVKPAEEVPETKEVEKKKDVKGAKKQQDDTPSIPKALYPSLFSLTIADVKERPEFAIELLAKLTVMAPSLKHFNVVNAHRNAPGHQAAPSPVKPRLLVKHGAQ